MDYLLKMVIFHSYVSLPDGILRFNQQNCDFNYCSKNSDSNTTAGV